MIANAAPAPHTAAAVIAATLEIPTVPAIAAQVMQAVENPNTTAAKLAQIVGADQGISGRLLKVCNSAFYGLPRQVSSLQQAIAILGFRELVNLTIAASSRNLYKSFGPREQFMWRHAVGAAVASRYVSLQFMPALKDQAFVAGQMHDVGKVIMNNALPQKMATVDFKLWGDDGLAAEQGAFGYTHADVGALLMKKWNLPTQMEAVAFHHHDPGLCNNLQPAHAKLVACVALANHLCHRVDAPEAPEAEPPDCVLDALEILGLDGDDLPTMLEGFRAKAEAERSALL